MPWEITANIKGPPGDPADIAALQAEIGDPHIVAAHTDLVGYIGEIDERLLLLEGSGEPPTATSHLFVDNYSNGFIRVSAGSISASITVDLALATTPGPGGAVYPALGDIPGQAAAWADFNGTLGKMKTSQGADVLGAAIKEWIRKGSILTVHKDTTDAAHPVLVVDTIVTPTPAGSNLSLGHLKNVDPTADSAASGKVLGTTAAGQWGAIDPPAGGLSQAQADARYLQLTGGTVTVRARDSIYGHDMSLSINPDEGLMIGTIGPSPGFEQTGVVFLPRSGIGDGSYLVLSSPYPVQLQAPDGVLSNDLVSKGYVDAKAAVGSARGAMSGSVPSGSRTKLTLVQHVVTGGLTIANDAVTVPRAGFYNISCLVAGFALMTEITQRVFASIVLKGPPDTTIGRNTAGAGEDRLSVTAMAWLEAGAQIQFDAYDNAGASTITTSFFYIKYLGAT